MNNATENIKINSNVKLFFLISGLLVLLDQATKLAIKGFSIGKFTHSGLQYGELIPVIDDILQITYIENAGMAFGISFGWGKIFLSIFSLVASGAIAYYLYKLCTTSNNNNYNNNTNKNNKNTSSNLIKLAVALILAGAFGNAIDRNFYGVLFNESPLFYGKVVDFILVDIPDINFLGLNYTHFPVFNVADSCVTCGMILLLALHNHLPEFHDLFHKKTK